MPPGRQNLFLSLKSVFYVFRRFLEKIQRRGDGTKSGDFQLSLLKFLKQEVVLYVNGKR